MELLRVQFERLQGVITPIDTALRVATGIVTTYTKDLGVP